ncbi:MAG TPA: DUF5009 domain-containing protein [Cyanobacteria bacterium UBA8553]|nr:DUF5009 domain-containing protein [Cyanobacteria bacterium UBA8553]HAJ58458.1 DUF5009 domain-containing protein [Cyanobacteria bacterium UBA8543]
MTNNQQQSKLEKSTIINQKRAYALDALRGFAILTMVLSGTIAYRILPAWMYHAQEPPPTHSFNPNLPGLTWVDLVFPLFLFSMGASIPLALSSRLAQGFLETILYILKRGFLLGTFAIFLQHIRPFTLSKNPTEQTWWIALFGFFILFFMFVRWPTTGKFGQYGRWIKLSVWLAALILVSFLRYPDGSGFSLSRSDIILIVLTNMAVIGSLAWLFTKSNLLLRLGFMGLLIALRLSANADGWISWFWSASPVPWLLRFDYLKYLFIVIPGTIAGDLILDWQQSFLKNKVNNEAKNSRNTWRLVILVLLMLATCLGLLIGLQSRLVWQTTLLSLGLCLLSWLLLVKPLDETEVLIKSFYQWGVYYLALGLFFEPFEGGIKKDPSTMSYYFTTTAIAFFILIIFTIVIDIFKGRKFLQLLIDNGQNPMIAYVGFANLLWPILTLTKLDELIIEHTQTPVRGFLKGLVYTLIIGSIVSFFTKRKLFWKT